MNVHTYEKVTVKVNEVDSYISSGDWKHFTRRDQRWENMAQQRLCSRFCEPKTKNWDDCLSSNYPGAVGKKLAKQMEHNPEHKKSSTKVKIPIRDKTLKRVKAYNLLNY